jgi:hypothetical protein
MDYTNGDLKVRYRRVLPIFLIAAGALTFYDFLLEGSGEPVTDLMTPVMLLVAILMLSRPVALLMPEEIQIKNFRL